MFNRRSMLLSLFALPLPFAEAVAQPWWDERSRGAEWEREREAERRRHEERRETWDEGRARAEWERQRRLEAQREWEREHGPYRR